MPYNPRLFYIRGVTNTLADALSRMYDLPEEGNNDTNANNANILIIKTDQLSQQLILEQQNDSYVKTITSKLDKFPDYVLVDEVLYHRSLIAGRSMLRIVVPTSFRGRILEAYHDSISGHQGIYRTFNSLRTKYYWPGYHQDVVKFIKTCITCQQADKQRSRIDIPTMQMPIVDIFDTMGIDVMGPLPETERHNRYLVVIVDHATKWVEAFPTKDVTSTTIADILYTNVICRFGPPKTLHSDRGTNFLSKVVKSLCDIFSIKKSNTTSYHPECNGQVERLNGVLSSIIRKLMIEKPANWDVHIPAAVFSYRITPHSVTQLSPYQLVYGRLPRLPIDVSLNELIRDTPRDVASYSDFVDTITEMRNYAKIMIEESQSHAYSAAATYENPYHVGDLVWLYTPIVKTGDTKKFSVFWQGPYKIIEVVTPVNCIIEDIKSLQQQRVHITRLKFYLNRDPPMSLPDDLRLEDEEIEYIPLENNISSENSNEIEIDNGVNVSEGISPNVEHKMDKPDFYAHGKPYFLIEKLLGCKKRRHHGRRIRYYLVKWKNYGDEHNSWEPYYRLMHTGFPQKFHEEESKKEVEV